jgi:hypothetical protein
MFFIRYLFGLRYTFSNNSYFLNQEKYFVLLQVLIITVLIRFSFSFFAATGKIGSIMAPLLSGIPLLIQCFDYPVGSGITVERYPDYTFFF